MKPHNLTKHPEGGRFREVFRSGETVTTADGRQRSALTHIYFSLQAGEVSKFHKVAADEVWNLYRGSLLLYLWDGTDKAPVAVELSSEAEQFCEVVPAGMWQAAAPMTVEALVGCSVAPGFEFTDFTMLAADSAEAAVLLAIDPASSRFL